IAVAEPVAEGAPIAKDAIDPDLIKLKRARPKIGVITAAGLVFLSVFFLIRLNPDRRFGSSGAQPDHVAVIDVVNGNIGLDRFVRLDNAEPLMSHAIRATTAKGNLGMRVVPVRGTNDKVWIAMTGDGWEPPVHNAYTGRLRKLADMPFSSAVSDSAMQHPRPVFASAQEVRAGLSTNKVRSVSGDSIALVDGDKIGFDVADPSVVTIACTINDRLPTVEAWSKALTDAGLVILKAPPTSTAKPNPDIKPSNP